jgi:pyoverdine/dityrosine biosynthesis protein Dit1
MCLLNRTAVKAEIKARLEAERPSLGITRVSDSAVDALEDILRQRIRAEIHTHPSIGKTFYIK